jgi:hypothetical protein
MGFFLRLLVGLAFIGVGAMMVIRTRGFVDFFGYSDWAEQKLGGGGTYLLYKVVGIFFCFIGIMLATNLWDWFLQITLGSIIPRSSLAPNE